MEWRFAPLFRKVGAHFIRLGLGYGQIGVYLGCIWFCLVQGSSTLLWTGFGVFVRARVWPASCKPLALTDMHARFGTPLPLAGFCLSVGSCPFCLGVRWLAGLLGLSATSSTGSCQVCCRASL